MTFKILTNLAHDLLIILFLIVGLIILFIGGELIGIVIFLLAMIEDNLYKRR